MKYPLFRKKDGFQGERSIFLPDTVIEQLETDPITEALHITKIGYYPNAKNHYRERPEAIGEYILIYCIEGNGYLQVKDNDFVLNENQLIILPANIPHSYMADEINPWTIYWIHFKGHLASQFVKGLNVPTDIKSTVNSRINERIALFEEIFTNIQNGYSKHNIQYATTLFYHFLGTIKYIDQFLNARVDEHDKGDLIESAIYYMKNNIEKKVSISSIAKFIGYSTSHFSRLFTQTVGLTPNEYFNQIKIQKACILLKTTNMKINQICYKVGIHDSYYFSRLFKKLMKISPKEYRKQSYRVIKSGVAAN